MNLTGYLLSKNCDRKNRIQGDTRTLPSNLLAAVIVIASALLAFQPELRLAVPMLVGVTATVAVALAGLLYYGDRADIPWSPAIILAVALVLRLMFLFSPPQLSDDIYRYLWDGSTLLHGNNPYAAAPSAVQPPPGLTAIHSRINHPDYVTIYPPAAQVVFAGGAALGGIVTGLKTFLVLIDMGLCALLLLLLKRLGLPPWRAVLYAWNPLPVLEIAGSGHVDGAGLAMLIGAIFLLVMDDPSPSHNPIPLPTSPLKVEEPCNLPPLQGEGRGGDGVRRWPYLLSGALLACAGLVKLFPFVLAPVLFLLVPAGRRRHFAAGFLAALTALLLPFLPHLANMATSLDAYARTWEFAGFAFTTLRSVTGSGAIARLLLSTCFLLTVAGVVFRMSSSINRTPALSARGRLAVAACYAIAMALLLLTPTLHPWYALSLAVFLPFCAGPTGLLLCWVVFLTYRVQIPYFILGQWIENQQVTAAVFLAPVMAFVVGRFFGGSRQSTE